MEFLGMPLQVDADAFDTLQVDMKEFLNQELKLQSAAINGFGWFNIVLVPHISGAKCIRLCCFGSPSRDTCFIWVYNTVSLRYELYSTPYFPPVPSVLEMDPILTARTVEDLLIHVRHDTIQYLDSL
jgi:hypothetical protein